MKFTMIAPEEVSIRRFFGQGGDVREALDYFGKSTDRQFGPEAFVVQMRNRHLGAHFHDVDQFQILLGVPGAMYQRHQVPELMLHYADAFSTYGPISGEDPPLRFFTLRANATEFTGYMPRDRNLLHRRGRRQQHFDLSSVENGEQSQWLLGPDDDGLGALLLTASAGSSLPISSAERTGGQFVYLASGEVTWENRIFPSRSLGWLATNAPPPIFHCIEATRILVLSFPDPPTTNSDSLGERTIAV